MTSSIAATFANAASPSVTPTIEDLLIEIVLVDPKGARRKIKGMVGTFFSLNHENKSENRLITHAPFNIHLYFCLIFGHFRKDVIGNVYYA